MICYLQLCFCHSTPVSLSDDPSDTQTLRSVTNCIILPSHVWRLRAAALLCSAGTAAKTNIHIPAQHSRGTLSEIRLWVWLRSPVAEVALGHVSVIGWWRGFLTYRRPLAVTQLKPVSALVQVHTLPAVTTSPHLLFVVREASAGWCRWSAESFVCG